ncbi:hypothetical protein V5799_015372 [Amblyomma americanum]|uniref:Uncharacterized protein n=1 Tax=Amblyomma americanum TaxID=6943 RepID=A0AAQ4E0C4_AMBAM
MDRSSLLSGWQSSLRCPCLGRGWPCHRLGRSHLGRCQSAVWCYAPAHISEAGFRCEGELVGEGPGVCSMVSFNFRSAGLRYIAQKRDPSKRILRKFCGSGSCEP